MEPSPPIESNRYRTAEFTNDFPYSRQKASAVDFHIKAKKSMPYAFIGFC